MTALSQRIARVDLKWRLFCAALVELAYVVASRVIAANSNTITEAEINRTPLRLGAAFLFWILMRDVINARTLNPSNTRSFSLFAILLLTLSTPVLVGGYNVPLYDSIILAITSIPVALSEEVFFRGIVQNLGVKQWGIVRGLALMIVLFMAFHIGVIRPDFFGYGQVALMALILGVIYLKTGSLVTVIALHAAYDALDSVPRFFAAPDRIWGLVLLIPATLIAGIWMRPRAMTN